MTGEPISPKARMAALASSTARCLAEAEAAWPRRARASAKKAPSEEARVAFEIAAALSQEERAWLRAQLS